MRSLFLLALVLPSAALAVPMELNHQGRLHDAVGVPLNATSSVEVTLYDSPAGGTELWSDTMDVTFDMGYFTMALGLGAPLDSNVFAGDDAWLELAVDGGAPIGRVHIVSVPYAIRAGTAMHVDGGVVNASEIQVNGTAIIDDTGALVADIGLSGLATLECGTADEMPVWDGSAWTCGSSNTAHTHDASEIDAGTLDIGRLPVGGSSSHVAAGDHTHATLTGDLAVGGHVQVGDSVGGCASGTEGALRYDGLALQLCDGSAWETVWAGQSCASILASHPSSTDGEYWVSPNGGSAFKVDCDMANGGWFVLTTSAGADNYWGTSAADPMTKCGADGVTSYVSGDYAPNYQYTAAGEERVFDVTYQSAGADLTADQMDALRSVITTLGVDSQLWGGDCDSDNRNPGHQARAVARNGNEALLTPTPSGNNVWQNFLYQTTSDLPAEFLLPHQFRLGHYSADAHGGGAWAGWQTGEIRAQ